MAIFIKSVSWVAVAAVVGVALRRYWLDPAKRVPIWPVVAATAAVPLFGALDLWSTVGQVRSPVSFDLWWRYASTTAHGHAVLWRSVAAALLALTVSLGPRSWWPISAAAGVWLCYGFSRLSHAAAMGGFVPLAYDLVHLVGAVLWAGGVWVVTFARDGSRATLRLSALALWTVVVLGIAGIMSALVHAGDPQRFFWSGYALALAFKLLAVALALVLAARNRFVLVPRAVNGDPAGLRRSMYMESAVLLAVLVLTGWLSTSPVPHGQDASLGALENLGRVIEYLTR